MARHYTFSNYRHIDHHLCVWELIIKSISPPFLNHPDCYSTFRVAFIISPKAVKKLYQFHKNQNESFSRAINTNWIQQYEIFPCATLKHKKKEYIDRELVPITQSMSLRSHTPLLTTQLTRWKHMKRWSQRRMKEEQQKDEKKRTAQQKQIFQDTSRPIQPLQMRI